MRYHKIIFVSFSKHVHKTALYYTSSGGRHVQVFLAETTGGDCLVCLFILLFYMHLSTYPTELALPTLTGLPNASPRGGLSCPVVPQMATRTNLSLKALTFTRPHRAMRGGVTFTIFLFPPGGKMFAMVTGAGQESHCEFVKKC